MISHPNYHFYFLKRGAVPEYNSMFRAATSSFSFYFLLCRQPKVSDKPASKKALDN
jgi:hypothetical protein